jgi:hypothetical protein
LTCTRSSRASGEAEADVAGARNHHAAHARLLGGELLHDEAHVLARRDEEDLVVLLDRGLALRQDAAPFAVDRGDAHLAVRDVRAQLMQLVPDELAALERAHAGEQHATVRELEDLKRSGVADESLDVVGDELFRADREIDRDRVVAVELLAAVVIGGADARNLGRRLEQGPCDLAGDHVDLVARGHREEEVGALAARGEQRRRVGGIAGYGADVEAVLQLAQHLVARVDDGDVVRLLARELLRGRAADLAGSEDDDLHASPPVGRGF